MAMDWADQYRGEIWQFQNYRANNRIPGPLTVDWLNGHRALWANAQVPLQGPVRPTQREDGAGVARIPVRADSARSVLAPPPPPGASRDKWQRARGRYDEVSNFFGTNPQFTILKDLGWGGNGLALKARWVRLGQGHKPLMLVIKVALRGWEDETLYIEERMMRRLKRAAHTVQHIPREDVGLPPNRPFPTDWPKVMNDTSSESDESGDESYDDAPTPRAARHAKQNRRQQIAADPERFTTRKDRYEQRVTRARWELANRRRAIEQGSQDPRWQIDRKDFLLLEWVENGDLYNLISRLNERNVTQIPNRVLWGFWLCLVRACLAMQYPPRRFHPGRSLPDPDDEAGYDEEESDTIGVDVSAATGKRVGNDLFETEPVARRRWAASRIVHFDIDPNNVLIGGLDPNCGDNEHDIVPRLKLADFGLAQKIRPNKNNEYYRAFRRFAKWGYFAPEQFGEEWDYIKKPDGSLIDEEGPEIAEQKIAGNYGAHTNVWGIALTMWQLITRSMAPLPPRRQDPPPGMTDVHYAQDIQSSQYTWLDPDLRLTIQRCMAHDPSHRPSLRQLFTGARNGVSKIFAAESDELIEDWVQKFIFDA
ncbi:kinase-like domain-containing protein [Xylariaceae sp. FL0255]|nr:kinase-like domain-containing protein [Xylariaceae sp. FL0255]